MDASLASNINRQAFDRKHFNMNFLLLSVGWYNDSQALSAVNTIKHTCTRPDSVYSSCPKYHFWQQSEKPPNPDCIWSTLPASHSPTHPLIFETWPYLTLTAHTFNIYTHTHTHTLSPINCPFLSLLKHTHSRSSSAPVCLLTWPKLRSQNVNFLPWAVLVCFFLQHQKCLRSIAEFTVWQIYWLGQWVSVWAPLALI